MTELIDNTALFDQAHHIISTAIKFIEKLEHDVVQDTPAKVETVAMIKFIIETQSQAIRNLVEQQAEICDRLNEYLIKQSD